jgi:hypothetical protein
MAEVESPYDDVKEVIATIRQQDRAFGNENANDSGALDPYGYKAYAPMNLNGGQSQMNESQGVQFSLNCHLQDPLVFLVFEKKRCDLINVH